MEIPSSNSNVSHRMRATALGTHVISVQNLSPEGFSGIQFIDETGIERSSIGWRNATSIVSPVINSSSELVFTNTLDASSATTGSVIIRGGVGIARSLRIENSLHVMGGSSFLGDSVTVSTPTEDFHVATKSYVNANSNNVIAGEGLIKTDSTLSVTAEQPTVTSVGTLLGMTSSGATVITNTTDSNSTSTGALRVTGGVGIQGTLSLGGNLNVSGTATLASTTVPAPTSMNHVTTKAYVDSATYLTAGTGLSRSGSTFSVNTVQSQITLVGTLAALNVSGVGNITNATQSSSDTTGALRISGGVGIQKNLNVEGSIFASNLGVFVSNDVITWDQIENKPNFDLKALAHKDVVNWTTDFLNRPDISQPRNAGTGLSLNVASNTLSINSIQSQMTSLGTLTGFTSSGSVVITNTGTATTSTTGALTVAGGVGVQNTVSVGSNLNVSGTTSLTGSVNVPNPSANGHVTTKSYVDEATYLTAGTGLTKTGSNFSVNAVQTQITSLGTLSGLNSTGIIAITNNTASTSATTGALRVAGGIGIGGSLFVGQNLNVNGTTTLNGAVSVPIPSGNPHATPKSYVDGATYLTGGTGLTITNATLSVDTVQSHITSVGTLTSLTVSGIMTVTNNTQSSSTTTGAVRISGGVGVQQNVHVGGNISAENLGKLAHQNNINLRIDVSEDLALSSVMCVPPKPMTGSSTTILSNPIWSGSYVASASSTWAADRPAWRAFDGLITDWADSWRSSAQYVSPGHYTGSVSTVADGKTYLGEWLQLQMPVDACLLSLAVCMDDEIWSPREYTLVGSNDAGSTWHLIQSKDMVPQVNRWVEELAMITTRFTHFRFIVRSTWSGTTVRVRGLIYNVFIPG
jgi:hypothetical protein